ncbi:hypothetical protein M2138_001082 [Dysgonomonadaceae bacterium PH5-43]|nr:hypothetical protein [Dysgonomonadaceae bacterium PH5-43]
MRPTTKIILGLIAASYVLMILSMIVLSMMV